MTRLACWFVFACALGGCPAPGAAPREPAPPAAGGVGCPAADHVYLASYLTRDDAAGTAGGHTGWVLPLHALKVDSTVGQPEYTTLDATTAGALGVPAAPASAWLMVPGQAPCKLTIGAYYGAAVDASVPNVTYGVELDGCAAPPKDQQQDAEAIVLISDQPPTACQFLAPQPIAARLGEPDAQQQWQRPTRETPIPPAVAAAIPQRDCRAPGCEMLWSFTEVAVAGRPAMWAGAVNWLTIPAGASPASACSWKADTFAGFFVPGPDGNAVKVTEGQDHPLVLVAVLGDHTRATLAVAAGVGEYATYDLTVGTARLARHLTWLMLPADAYAVDERIGPTCSEER